MAVVVSTFYTNPGDSWASGTTASELLATDAAFKVNTALTNWIAAINNPDWIKKHSTSDPITYRTDGYYIPICYWDLVLNEGETRQYGLQFMRRHTVGDYASGSWSQLTAFRHVADYAVSATSMPEGISYSIYYATSWSFSGTSTHFLAYEGSGLTPWFCYAYKKGSSTEMDMGILLARASKSNIVPDTYYPGSGISQWVAWDLAKERYIFPQDKYGAPSFYGTGTGMDDTLLPKPLVIGRLFNIHSLQGSSHLFGQISEDIMVSSSGMGAFGDTVKIKDKDYTCLPRSDRQYWIKTGE